MTVAGDCLTSRGRSAAELGSRWVSFADVGTVTIKSGGPIRGRRGTLLSVDERAATRTT